MNIKKKYNLIQTVLLALTLLVASPTLTMAANAPKEEKSNYTLAMEVIRGDWGNGQKRKDSLIKAGYEYQPIQDIVNSYNGILYSVFSTVESNIAVKQNETQKTEQVSQAEENEKVENEKVENEKVENEKVQSGYLYSLRDLQFHGVINWNGYKFTYYSQSVLPGGGLRIPGRHVNADGYVADKDGYIVLANDAPKGTVIPTPFGYMGKVYDRGTYGNHFDVYTK